MGSISLETQCTSRVSVPLGSKYPKPSKFGLKKMSKDWVQFVNDIHKGGPKTSLVLYQKQETHIDRSHTSVLFTDCFC